MSKLVYLRDRFPKTFLHLSTKSDGFRLRDFSSSKHTKNPVVARDNPNLKTSDILNEVNRVGNHILPAEDHDITDYDFWHQKIVEKNRQYLNLEEPSKTDQDSWLSKHLREIIIGVIISIISGLILFAVGVKS